MPRPIVSRLTAGPAWEEGVENGAAATGEMGLGRQAAPFCHTASFSGATARLRRGNDASRFLDLLRAGTCGPSRVGL
jgi:hypothetical protein